MFDRIHKEDTVYTVAMVGVITLAAFIRLHNLFHYTTWWADDGGAHIAYVETILAAHRFPTSAETYLAWHEPGFYVLEAVWTKLGQVLGVTSLNWQESLNVLISLVFLFIAWLLAMMYAHERWVAWTVFFLLSVLFVGVKLSAYLNNELLAQTFMLMLVYLCLRWRLFETGRWRYVFIWAGILGVATLIKLTAVIVLLAALIMWVGLGAIQKRWSLFAYAALTIMMVGLMNLPWLVYKQRHFGRVFSINLVEQQKYSIWRSPAWAYIGTINPRVFVDYPYWFAGPHSFSAIVIADTFGDYYNLFNQVDRINLLPPEQRLLVQNGRFTTAELWQALLCTNRLGLLIVLIWCIGICGAVIDRLRQKNWQPYEIFLGIIFLGGWLALLYNNLRVPYLERGVLKTAFIYMTFPIGALIAYTWWYQKLKQSWLWVLVCVAPLLLYSALAWPMLVVN